MSETRYTVTVTNCFDATSPEDAVRQMIAFLDDDRTRAAYEVSDGDHPRRDVLPTVIDAETIDFDTPQGDSDEWPSKRPSQWTPEERAWVRWMVNGGTKPPYPYATGDSDE